MDEFAGDRSQILSLRGVSYSYASAAGRRQVLRDVSADVWPGEIVLVVGPSGSGKTTMLTLAGALRSVESGSIVVLRQELSGATPRQSLGVRRRIGFIFQDHNLLESLSVLDNVRTALMPLGHRAENARQQCVEALRAVGLESYVHARPNQLSIGQQQRVAIARALVRKPELVLADEPTASLDAVSGREVVELLRQLARAQGCAIVIVTHDSRILDLADRNLAIEDGHLRSYTSMLTAESVHMMTVLAAFRDAEGLDRFWSQFGDADFLDLLRKLRLEATQFLNVMDFAFAGGISEWLEMLLQSVLRKAAGILGARQIAIRTTLGGGRDRVYADAGAGDCIEGELFRMELRDRSEAVIGVAEIRSSVANIGQWRDFEKPIGLLLETCIRTET